MADPALPLRRSAFADLARPGRLGVPDGPAGVTVTERTGLALAHVAARQGHADALASALRDRLGLACPRTPAFTTAGALTVLWAGPGQWLVVSEAGGPGHPGTALVAQLTEAAPGLGAVTDQTDGRGVLRLAGPRVRDLLATGLALDLHPRAFRPGMAALTRLTQVDAMLWQVDDTPTFDLAVARGYAGSVWHWLAESGAQYGLEVG